MGFFLFIKEVGEKLLGYVDVQVVEDLNVVNQIVVDVIKNYISL